MDKENNNRFFAKIRWSELFWMREALCQDILYYSFVDATKYNKDRHTLDCEIISINANNIVIMIKDSNNNDLKLTLSSEFYSVTKEYDPINFYICYHRKLGKNFVTELFSRS